MTFYSARGLCGYSGHTRRSGLKQEAWSSSGEELHEEATYQWLKSSYVLVLWHKNFQLSSLSHLCRHDAVRASLAARHIRSTMSIVDQRASFFTSTIPRFQFSPRSHVVALQLPTQVRRHKGILRAPRRTRPRQTFRSSATSRDPDYAAWLGV